jgi:signal transduction histidine kinase
VILQRLRHSLWFRLTWRTLAIVAALAAAFLAAVNISATGVVGRLIESTLALQSAQLLPYAITAEDGETPAIPDTIREAYAASADTLVYAVLDRRGRVLWASTETVRGLLSRRPLVLDAERSFFRLTAGDPPTSYSLLAQRVPDGRGTVLIVGRGIPEGQGMVLALRSIAAQNMEWIVAALVAAALLAALWTVWASLAPLRRLAHVTPAGNADMPGALLPAENLPVEMQRLAHSINMSFDRLSRAYEAHRNFTAMVAHELRSPVTLLSLKIHDLKDDPARADLRQDVDQMKRLVEQLAAVVRADALPLSAQEEVDLVALVRDVVATLAPGAAARQVRLGLSAPRQPVLVLGDRLSLWLAVRNLIENGINHTAPDTEVELAVSMTGTITVRDHGPGIPLADRARIFERFWRRPDAPPGGSGLGLAIVAEVAAQHGGAVSVTDARGGGALFTLQLPLCRERV